MARSDFRLLHDRRRENSFQGLTFVRSSQRHVLDEVVISHTFD